MLAVVGISKLPPGFIPHPSGSRVVFKIKLANVLFLEFLSITIMKEKFSIVSVGF